MEICPTREVVVHLLERAGAPVDPVSIGMDRGLFHESLMKSYNVRKRYSILQLALDEGVLKECADKITERIYGKAE